VSNIIDSRFSEPPLKPRAVAIPRGLPKGEGFFRGNSPMMGSFESTGVKGVLLADVRTMDSGSFPGGWLYIQVAHSTVDAPMTNEGVIRKSKRMTDAKKDSTIERLVAKPFKMLSEYFMTMAVTNPPNTCIATVAQAHIPKFLRRPDKKPGEVGVEV